MIKNLVLSLIGHDRVGLVERLTKLVVDIKGNIEASRMAHLGGEFAILMFISRSFCTARSVGATPCSKEGRTVANSFFVSFASDG